MNSLLNYRLFVRLSIELVLTTVQIKISFQSRGLKTYTTKWKRQLLTHTKGSAKVTRIFAGKISVGLVNKIHTQDRLWHGWWRIQNFIYIKTLQSGKTRCGQVKCYNFSDRSSCEKYKLSLRLILSGLFHCRIQLHVLYIYTVVRYC